jgi:putative flippase GtrA
VSQLPIPRGQLACGDERAIISRMSRFALLGWEPRPGEIAAIIRFGLVGVTATLAYLGASVFLLDRGINPGVANLAAFGVGTVTSYLGHYFFTYRSGGSHLKLGSRFFLVTACLVGMGVVLHHVALLVGATPRLAALFVSVVYPPLSFGLNHFWAFARGKQENTI